MIRNKPKRKNLISAIKSLKKLSDNDYSLDEVKKYVFNKMDLLTITIREYSEFKSTLFRARSLSANENISLQSTYSYPKYSNNIGRANLKSKPVFYGSTDLMTAVLEFIKETNEESIIYVSEWRYKRKSQIKSYPLIDFSNKTDHMKEQLNSCFGDGSEDLILEFTKLIKELFKKEFNYNFSASFSHKLLYNMCCCNMIEYPSVVTKGLSYNFAINKDFVDEWFCIERVFKIKIVGRCDYKNAKYDSDYLVGCEYLEIGNPDKNGEIIYSKMTESDYEYVDSFSDVVIRDGVVLKNNYSG